MNKHCILGLLIYICVSDIRGQMLEEQALLSYTRCLLDDDCHGISNNSFCFENDAGQRGVCKCTDGYELLTRNKTFFSCLKHARYGESCEKNIQCQIPLSVNAVCDVDKKTCRCADWAHLYTDGKCYSSVLLEDFCQTDGNCYLGDGTFGNCVSGRCICKFDLQVPAEDKKSCIESRRIGQSCEDDFQCSVVSNAVCRASCVCAAGYTLSQSRSRCLRAATKFFDPCEEDQQCSEFLQGGYCRAGNCTCADGEHGYGSRCFRSALIGAVCTSSEECIPDTTFDKRISCSEGVCKCAEGFVDGTMGCNGAYRVYGTFGVMSVLFALLFAQ